MSLHTGRRLALLALSAFVAVGCNEQQLQQGLIRDDIPPVVVIQKTAGDTLQLADGIIFAVDAQDNLGIKDISITLSAGFSAQLDTTLNTAVTDATIQVNIPLPTNSTAGGVIVIDATVTDGNNNATTARDSLFLVNAQALTVRLLNPTSGAVTAPNLQIPVQVEAIQSSGVQLVGYTTTGVVTDSNSTTINPAQDTAQFNGAITIPGNTQSGTFTVQGFAVDSSGRQATSSSVTVTVQQTVTDTVPPFVTFSVPPRAEIRDSITVTANDPGGVQSIRWEARDLNGNIVSQNNATSSGTLTQVSGTFNLNLNFATFPQAIEIRAFGTDQDGNTGEARVDTTFPSPILRDTITVVNGLTRPLPAGGRVADAIFNPNQNEFYLTNILLNRIEVFRLVDSSYVPGGILVGSEPFGLAMWPDDNAGNYRDTVVVANSGGTDLSIVDVRPGARRQVRRHRLPNFLVQTVTTEQNQTGTVVIKFTEYDFADRPQYLGVTCRGSCASDSVYAVYSTTPTPGQTPPFENRSTVRWENISTAGAPHSHFFWEHSQKAPSPDFDSLRIFVDRGVVQPFDTVLSIAKGVMVDLDELAFQETAFVRSSGDATHALVGEGGSALLGRAVGYDGTQPIIRTIDTTTIVTGTVVNTFFGPTEVDPGITPGIRVRDEVANTATPIRSISINFNGLTNMMRADSVYILDENLRLAGTIPVDSGNSGMDVNFLHAFDPFIGGTAGTFGGTADSSLRMVFLARDDANIDVFDTFFYARVSTIPIRDPLIGPLRVALIPGPPAEQVLIGVTARGVVMIRIPQIPNTFPDRITEPSLPPPPPDR